MKIYFIASLSGRDKYQENYEEIVKNLKKMGHKILSEHALNADPDEIGDVEEEKEFYKQVQDWINKADVVVAEVSQPSTNVGHEVSMALTKNKPVVLFHVNEHKPIIFEGIDSDRVQLIKYNLDSIKDDLKFALDFASDQQDTRFNFFISPKHQNYLDWVAKNKRVPRSVFLRRLIEDHMEQNEEYP